MKNIGFNFTTNDFRYAVIEKDGVNLNLIEKNRIVYPKSMSISELTGWFETQINLLLNKHNPDKVGYKISLSLTSTKSIQNSIYPLGILNLSCHKKGIPIKHYTSQGINATKFGLKKKDSIYDYVDKNLGKYPPYWDKQTKDALLTAWFQL
jgi:Holliday junction resolvasome RuvABC endonuclease subunit